jgi:hypothetical protein
MSTSLVGVVQSTLWENIAISPSFRQLLLLPSPLHLYHHCHHLLLPPLDTEHHNVAPTFTADAQLPYLPLRSFGALSRRCMHDQQFCCDECHDQAPDDTSAIQQGRRHGEQRPLMAIGMENVVGQLINISLPCKAQYNSPSRYLK